jgi:hypothetical protein
MKGILSLVSKTPVSRTPVSKTLSRALGVFMLVVGLLCCGSDSKATITYTLLVASNNGQTVCEACELLNHCLLDDKGEANDGYIRGLSYIDGPDAEPDRLNICNVGDGRVIPENLRRADVLVLAYGGRNEERGTINFESLSVLHRRLMGRMLRQAPQVVLLELEYKGSPSYQAMRRMVGRLGARHITADDLRIVHEGWSALDRTHWIYYRARPEDDAPPPRRLPPPSRLKKEGDIVCGR